MTVAWIGALVMIRHWLVAGHHWVVLVPLFWCDSDILVVVARDYGNGRKVAPSRLMADECHCCCCCRRRRRCTGNVRLRCRRSRGAASRAERPAAAGAGAGARGGRLRGVDYRTKQTNEGLD